MSLAAAICCRTVVWPVVVFSELFGGAAVDRVRGVCCCWKGCSMVSSALKRPLCAAVLVLFVVFGAGSFGAVDAASLPSKACVDAATRFPAAHENHRPGTVEDVNVAANVELVVARLRKFVPACASQQLVRNGTVTSPDAGLIGDGFSFKQLPLLIGQIRRVRHARTIDRDRPHLESEIGHTL